MDDRAVIGTIALASTRDERAGASLANYIGTRMVELVGIGRTVSVYRTRAEAVTAHRRELGEEFVERGEQVAWGDAAAGWRDPGHGEPPPEVMASDR